MYLSNPSGGTVLAPVMNSRRLLNDSEHSPSAITCIWHELCIDSVWKVVELQLSFHWHTASLYNFLVNRIIRKLNHSHNWIKIVWWSPMTLDSISHYIKTLQHFAWTKICNVRVSSHSEAGMFQSQRSSQKPVSVHYVTAVIQYNQ